MLAICSLLLLLFSVYGCFRYKKEILHPAFWTNFGFIGYSLCGLYYAAFGYSNASFINLSSIDIDRPNWFAISIMVVLIGWLSCNIGFAGADYVRKNSVVLRTAASKGVPSVTFVRIAKLSSLALIFLGTLYWIYFSYRAAGGVIQLFSNVAAFRYMARDAHLSSIPFHLVYAGAALWMLAWIASGPKRWIGLAALPISIIIALSTGRISFTITIFLSIFFSYKFIANGTIYIKDAIYSIFISIFIGIIFYFFRIFSSYNYIGKADQFPLINEAAPSAAANLSSNAPDVVSNQTSYLRYIIDNIFSHGNVPDLQQIILILYGIKNNILHRQWGATYLDWFINLVNSHVGKPDHVRSVGNRILGAYFPDKVGGPTPGMIGEAILNFGYMFPIILLAMAFFVTIIYNYSTKSGRPLVIFIYCQFIIGMWALFLKVDSSLILGFLWMAIPMLLCWVGVLLLTWFWDRFSLQLRA